MMHSAILLISCYELGHQPLSLAWPLAALRAAGLGAATADLAVEEFPTAKAAGADLIAVAVPMHTALRIGVDAAHKARTINPGAHLCFFGLYAWLNRRHLLQPGDSLKGVADSVIAGETEPVLVALAQALHVGSPLEEVPGLTTAYREASPHLGRHTLPVPVRNPLPSLDSYAHYVPGSTTATNGSAAGNGRKVEEPVAYPAGYTEATRGCLHTCRHCPVVPVYNGRFFVVPVETVLADIAQQVESGARHITFGDPDFLNGWRHSRKVVRAMHARFPDLTFDCTTKVEHILEHAHVWPEFAGAGCLFVISAFESLNDEILWRLDKGHVAAEAEQAVTLLRRHGIETRPSWLPFTPWTTFADVLDILDFVADHDLVGNVDPVQYSIRLLLPKGSLLLDLPDMQRHLGPYDEAQLSYTWQAADPAVDALQAELATLLATLADADTEIALSYAAVREAVLDAAGASAEGRAHGIPVDAERAAARPRLTEAWFCCAEPTELQFAQLAGI